MKLIFTLFITVFTLFNFAVNAQQVLSPQRAIGSKQDEPYLAYTMPTSDHGYLVVGNSYGDSSGNKTQKSYGKSDIWIVKYDAAFNKLWDKAYGGENWDEASYSLNTDDGGYLIGGYSHSNISGSKSENSRGVADYWLLKINKDGNKLWDKTFGGNSYDLLTSVISTKDGGYLLSGSSSSGANGDKTQPYVINDYDDFWLVKTDNAGNKLWDKTYGGKYADIPQKTVPLPDGGFIVFGQSLSPASGDKTVPGYEDAWAIRIDSLGNKIWDKGLKGTEDDAAVDCVVLPDGFVVLMQSLSGVGLDKTVPNNGAYDLWVVKMDFSGNFVWQKGFGGGGYDFAGSIQKTQDGNLLIESYSDSGLGGDKTEDSRGQNDLWFIKIDMNGNKIWDKTVGGSGNESASRSGAVEIATNVFMVGCASNSPLSGDKTVGSQGGYDYWVFKLQANNLNAKATSIAPIAKSNLKGFEVYPNPASTTIKVYTNVPSTVAITDVNGKTLVTKNSTGTIDFNLSRYTPGIYYLKDLKSGESRKIVVTH